MAEVGSGAQECGGLQGWPGEEADTPVPAHWGQLPAASDRQSCRREKGVLSHPKGVCTSVPVALAGWAHTASLALTVTPLLPDPWAAGSCPAVTSAAGEPLRMV